MVKLVTKTHNKKSFIFAVPNEVLINQGLNFFINIF